MADGWCVYILLCDDGSLYTGSTNDISRRLAAHLSGRGAKYTRSRKPLELAYCEELPEAEIKKLSRPDKLRLTKSGTNLKND